MGNQQSSAVFDPAHIRIYSNILKLHNPQTRVQMIQTCLSSIEYVQTAKRAGIYSYLLSYVSSVQNGNPILLPGEQAAPQQHNQYTHQPVQSIPYMPHANPVSTSVPRSSQTSITQFQEPVMNHYQVVTQTSKQKVVSYFASCLEVLGIQEEVALTEDILKKAYKKIAIKAHPDKGGSEEHFEAITRAYAYLSEILKRVQGGRDRPLQEVSAPTHLESGRKEESKQWQHVEPVRLNPKNLNVQAFNDMFDKTHIPDPDSDGYGDWLKTTGEDKSAPKFGGKFNRDVFNNMFDQEARKNMVGSGGQVIIHPEAMALSANMGVEIGRDRPDSYTSAPNAKTKFVDLRDAYTTESTISNKVANVRVEERTFEGYRANREKGPAPFSQSELQQLNSSEMELKRREEMRQRRKAEQDNLENRYFERMKQLVITDK
jgi:curved DNA-binding protein CbpA